MLGDISGYVGTLSVQLFWSRDQASYVGVTMALLSGNDVYRATIPAQDGSDNYLYDFGWGICYWYIKISNNADEEDYLFTDTNPNTEIFFIDPSEQETTEVFEEETETPAFNPLSQLIEDTLGPIFGDVTKDPLFQAIILLFFGIIIVLAIVGTRADRLIGKAIGALYRRR